MPQFSGILSWMACQEKADPFSCLFYSLSGRKNFIHFFFLALLKYNWYTKCYTYLMLTSWWVWTYAHTCGTIIISKIQRIHHFQTFPCVILWFWGGRGHFCFGLFLLRIFNMRSMLLTYLKIFVPDPKYSLSSPFSSHPLTVSLPSFHIICLPSIWKAQTHISYLLLGHFWD